MIRRLVLSNFYSFRDHAVIDLSAPGTVPDAPNRLVAPSERKPRFPRVVSLYGPNASGKSTVLRAISFLTYFIEHSFSLAEDQPIFCSRFAAEDKQKEPIFLEIEFDAPINLDQPAGSVPTCPLIYNISLNGGTEEPLYIESENLWQHPPDSTRRVKVFERNKDGLVSGNRSFSLQGYTKPLKKVLRRNASLISTLSHVGHEKSRNLRRIASRVKTNIYTQSSHEGVLSERYLSDEKLLAGLNAYISRLDFGVSKVNITKAANDRSFPDAHYHHRGLEKPLHISSESQGTRHFFRIFPIIYDALSNGGVAIIDEMDSSIHSLLLPEIIHWFFDEERNPYNAQLWFTCQNPFLLENLTKEEVLFTEKDDSGGSAAFMLKDIQNVRRADNYMKKYLGGAYGALPHFG